jgi:hypothetical protein
MKPRPGWREALATKRRLMSLQEQPINDAAAGLIEDARRHGLSLKVRDGRLRVVGGRRNDRELIARLLKHEGAVIKCLGEGRGHELV